MERDLCVPVLEMGLGLDLGFGVVSFHFPVVHAAGARLGFELLDLYPPLVSIPLQGLDIRQSRST